MQKHVELVVLEEKLAYFEFLNFPNQLLSSLPFNSKACHSSIIVDVATTHHYMDIRLLNVPIMPHPPLPVAPTTETFYSICTTGSVAKVLSILLLEPPIGSTLLEVSLSELLIVIVRY